MANDNKRTHPDARVAVAVSGSGRSLENFLRKQPEFSYDIVGVITSNPGCRGAGIARESGLPVFEGDFRLIGDTERDSRLLRWLSELQVSWISLAGFIRMFPAMPGFEQRIVNIHPALLPRFGGKGMYGAYVHQAVLEAKEVKSGATVHFVSDEYDRGQVISQVYVPVLTDDDAASLAVRVFAAECDLYPKTLSRLIEGSLPQENGQIWIYDYAE